ncbi:MAG TPA: hypothetical protein ENN65_04345 [Candidatus Hydrogenedentes bacterium]|nr:hypothetical protein [Candidatus Hydrogenedentota bacterium]
MRIERFLEKHGLTMNPFANAEEAQGDEVLLQLLEKRDFHFGHPQWPKFYGSPPGNQTSVVFGLKGSGKTAMRLALDSALKAFNASEQAKHDGKTLLINYDEFNTYLSAWERRMAETLRHTRGMWSKMRGKDAPRPDLKEHWKLTHHIDAILAETARHFEEMLSSREGRPHASNEHSKYDALFLAALFLPSRSHEYRRTLTHLRHRLFSGAARFGDKLGTALMCIGTLGGYWLYRKLLARALARRLHAAVQVIDRELPDLDWALRLIPSQYLKSQPLAMKGTDPLSESARYDLLGKAVAVCKQAGYARVAVVIDKVDEPTMLAGSYTHMSEFIRPMWNNKMLQTTGIHFKMLLPEQLYEPIRKGDPELMLLARPDKANMIHLEWSGEHLYEMLIERATVCKAGQDGRDFDLQDLFDPQISRAEIVAELSKTRMPRYAAKLFNRLLVETCESTLDADVQDTIPRITSKVFHQVTAEFNREMQGLTKDLQDS